MNPQRKLSQVLVIGGGGFLGAWVVRLLARSNINARIFELREDFQYLNQIAPEMRDDLDWVVGDVTDTDAVRNAATGCDLIIHLAGLMTPACQADPLLGAKVNVIGTLNVFEAAKFHGIPEVIYTSSGGVFGLEEGHPPFPCTHYGAFKLANEGNARAYWLDDQIASRGMRPFVIYGPGRDVGLTAGVSLACAAAAKGEPYTIPFRGLVGLVYVEDVARAYVQAAIEGFSGAETVNLTGQLTTVEEVAEIIRSLASGAQIDVGGDPIPCDSTAANEWQTCGFDLPAERSLSQGILETMQFAAGRGSDQENDL